MSKVERDNHLTDEEFLQRYETQIQGSPVLRAYHERLFALVHPQEAELPTNCPECPVCEAQLCVELDQHNGILSITVNEQ